MNNMLNPSLARKVPPEFAAQIKANGDNPDEFIWNEDTQEAVHVSQAGEMGIGEKVEQGLRNVTKGFGGALADTAGFAGRLMERFGPINQIVGRALRAGSKFGRRKLDESIYQDPRAADSILLNDIPQAIGQIGTVALPAGVASGAGKLGAMAVGGALGGSQAGEDAARQVAEKNEREGKPANEDEELIKGLVNAGMAGAVDAILGAGSLGRFLATRGGKGILKGTGKQAFKGGVGETIQQSGQDLLVEGAIDPAKSVRAGIVGTAVQGGTALGGKVLQGGDTPPKLPAPVEPETPAPVRPVQFSPEETEAAVTAEEWNVPNPTPVDKAIKKAKSSKIMLTPERVTALTEAYDGTETSEAEVNKRLRAFYIEDRTNLGPKNADDAAARAMENLPEEVNKIKKQIDSIDKTIKSTAELKAKLNAGTDTDAGTKWEMSGQYDEIVKQLEARRLRLHEQITKLMPPPKLEVDLPRDEYGRPMRMPVGQHGPAIPGSEINPASPVAPRFEGMDYRTWELPPPAQPAGLLPEMTPPHPGDRPYGPAIPLDDPNHGLKAIQRARGDTRPMNPAIARILSEYANQEGEQRPPFSVGNVNTPPTAEPVGVVKEQLKLTADEASTRKATLVTPGEVVGAIPAGLETVQTPHGTVVFNPKKVSAETVKQAGSGEVFDARVLGMVSDGGVNTGDKVVTASTPNAINVSAEVVNTPEGEVKAKQAARKAVPGGKIETKKVEEVTEQREVDRMAEDSTPAEDRAYNMGVPVGKILKAIKETTGVDLDVPKMLVHKVRGVAQRLAAQSPAGALFKAKANELFSLQRKLANRQYEAWAKIKKEINDPRFVKWLNDGLDTGKREIGKLPAELRNAGKEYERLLKEQHKIQTDMGVWVEEVRGGRPTYRPPVDVDNYALVMYAPEVYDAMQEGGKKWDKYEEAWLRQWKATKNPKNPGWETEARAALNDFMQPLAGGRFEGGEPLFNAVRKAHGVPLPIEWRSEDVYGSALKFVDKWSKDLAWGHVVQNNPVLRKYFGIRQNTKGEYVHSTDKDTFEGSEEDFETAVREGRKVGAEWVGEVNSAKDAKIQPLSDKAAKQSIIASYTGRPIGGNMTGDKFLEGANSLTGAMIMQLKTGLRDFSQSIGEAWFYTDFKDGVPAVRGMLEALANPNEAIRETKRAGAMAEHPIASEYAGVLGGAVYKASHAIRTFTGKNFLEEWGKSVAWHMFKEVALHQQKTGMSDLVEEFGSNDPRMTSEERAESAANTLLQQIQPDFSFRNMPDVLIPQNRRMLGATVGLMRWSVAKYNTWYENVWTPFKQGRPERLLKSVLLGSIFAGLTQEFLTWLSGVKPQNLTFREWMGLKDEKKAEEFAPMFFAYHQAQGTFGILGDLGLMGANLYAAKPVQRPDVSPQMPAAIVGTDLLTTLYSFAKYSQEVGINGHDLGELGMELMKINQNIRMLDNWSKKDEKPNLRERKLYEDLYGVSARTGEPIVGQAYREFLRTPFSLSKSLNKAETEEDFQRILPALINRSMKGQPLPPVKGQLQDVGYYAHLKEMYGEKEAARQVERDAREEGKAEMRKAVTGLVK